MNQIAQLYCNISLLATCYRLMKPLATAAPLVMDCSECDEEIAWQIVNTIHANCGHPSPESRLADIGIIARQISNVIKDAYYYLRAPASGTVYIYPAPSGSRNAT